MKFLGKFNTKDIKENDVLLFETEDKDFAAISQIQKFFEDLQHKVPENVTIICVRKGDFLSLKTEDSMNKLGWFRLSKGDKRHFPKTLNKVEYK